MPRVPLHALIWSRNQGLYELYTRGRLVQRFQPGDEAAWQSWLREVTSLAFRSPFGSHWSEERVFSSELGCPTSRTREERS